MSETSPFDYVSDLERMAKQAADPVAPGELVKHQLRRAARNLKMHKECRLFRRVRQAWYRDGTDSWSCKAYFEFRAAYDAFCDELEKRNKARQEVLRSQLSAKGRAGGRDESH